MMAKVFFAAFLAFFLFEKGLFAQKEAKKSPYQAWFEVDGTDSLFSLRAHFFSERTFPIHVFWRLQIFDGDQKTRESGDLIAFPQDATLLVEKVFSLRRPVENRSVDLVVLDGDQIIARKKLDLADVESFFDDAPEPKLTADLPPKQAVEKPILAKDDFGLELGGFVLDEMRTRPGREFFQKFMAIWQPPEKSEGWWIALRELPSPGRFTVLSVSLNNRELFQRFLPLAADQQTELAELAANYLVQLLGQGNFDGTFTDEDLNGIGIE